LSENIINGEIEIINEIKKKYPSLSNKPFFNDEADPLRPLLLTHWDLAGLE
jgi:hypothetical protein